MRKKIVAGNWKMHKTLDEGVTLVNEFIALLNKETSSVKPEIILCPPFIHLKIIADSISNLPFPIPNFHLGAQNCHFEAQGAFTGEISAAMLISVGAKYVIIGHSERRQYFSETNELLAKKIKAVLQNGLIPIYCCGETLEERKKGKQFEVVTQQLLEGVFHLSENEIQNTVIAYEPVWAIGTGVNATSEQAQEMHQFIRKLIAKQYNENIAEGISVLYGGSCKPDNAKNIFSQKDVDGGLIGGASLQALDFIQIARSF